MYVHHVFFMPVKVKKGYHIPGTGVIYGLCWKVNWGPWQEQQVI